MNDDDLKSLFGNADKATPSEEARARAKQAAINAFDATNSEAEKNPEQSQGNVTSLRPTTDNNPSVRRRMMNTINQRWIVSGVASAAVLVITVSVLMNVSNPVPDPNLMPEGRLVDAAGKESRGEDKREVVPQSSPESNDNPPPAKSLALKEMVVTTVRREESRQQTSVSVSEPSAQSQRLASGRAEADLAMADAAAPVESEFFVAGAISKESRVMAKVKSTPMPVDVVPPGYYQDEGRDQFEDIEPSPVKLVAEEPVSTFSVDVDTASYSFIRRQLNQGVLPQKDAVRVEELINYFDYDYPLPESKETPFKATVSVTDTPWKTGNKLIHIGIRGYDLPGNEIPASNLVFLLDVSGSMNSPDKLPLVKQSMGLLLSQLKPTDTVSIVAYAGAAGTVLDPTPVKDKQKILAAMERLRAGGSTAGGQGIKLAYQLAKANFDKNAVNRVILATDGDFNVGITNREELKGFVERQRKEGVYLSVLGFGQGNYNDHMMQVLAQNGNGVAAYIDTLSEAQKVLVEEATSTLFPIAKDVKIQLEFNPKTVSEYRLLGYETRALKREDFNNDKVDAGDIGAGHRVTAIYEVTPVGVQSGLIEPSRYADDAGEKAGHINEYGFLKIRYKLPEESKSKLITTPIMVKDQEKSDNTLLARETGFATAVAGFAELLRGGQYTGEWSYSDVIDLANQNKGEDLFGYRTEFVQLARKASVAQVMK